MATSVTQMLKNLEKIRILDALVADGKGTVAKACGFNIYRIYPEEIFAGL